MSKCIYCGMDAGIFRRKHRACHESFIVGRELISSAVSECLRDFALLDTLIVRIHKVAVAHYIDSDSLQYIIYSAWDKAVDAAFEDQLLTVDEEKCLEAIFEMFSIGRLNPESAEMWTLICKGAILRELSVGRKPEYNLSFPERQFQLKDGEFMVWLFPDTEYYVQNDNVIYDVMHGQFMDSSLTEQMYLGRLAFRGGDGIYRKQTFHINDGILAISNRRMFFVSSSQKDLIIDFSSVEPHVQHGYGVAFKSVEDESVVHCFKTNDVWFTYNLINILRIKNASDI